MTEKTSGKRKTAVVFGIIFVIIGVFLLTFGFSFKLMSVPSGNEALKDAQIKQLTEKINELEKENTELSEEKNDNNESVGTIPSTKTVKEGSSTAEPESVPASSSSSKNTSSSSNKTSTNKSTSTGTSSSSTSGGASAAPALSN